MFYMHSLKVSRPVLCSALLRNTYNNVLQKSDTIDVIDAFTNNLLKTKNSKWERFKRLQDSSVYMPETAVHVPQSANNSISHLTQKEIDVFLDQLLHSKDYTELVNILTQCTKSKRVIGYKIIARIAKEQTTGFDKRKLIDTLVNYLAIFDDKLLCDDAYYYIITEFYWSQGYFKKCLQFLTLFYNAICQTDRTKICANIMRDTIIDTIDDQSEAILVSVIQFCENIAIVHSDFSVLAVIWLKCLKSEQFSDHKFTMQLFEQHAPLQILVLKNSRTVCSSLLYKHNTDAIYRLIELFLTNNLKANCDLILVSLFEYYYWRKDVRACSEILQYCNELELTLHHLYYERLVGLILNRPTRKSAEGSIVVPKYKYKF